LSNPNNPSNPSTDNTSNPAIPTAAQLGDARRKLWHQQGEALLTLENLRSWVNAAGLVLFTPRPQIVSPAPSLVEAVLGEPNSKPTLEQLSTAKSLLGRLIAEGLAVPLNLLGAGPGTVHAGAPGDTPDFVASTAVFSYVFTLRGDKAWKQPPAATGPLKVSQLALATCEALTRRGPLTAFEVAAEVGKEVTEAAVLRALAELWAHLRVLPLPQPDGLSSLWEISSARFTKQIKAGANAGQPSALSALISLYLGQAIVASQDEIESFLSALAPRSRIRDVVHALLAARQLDTLAVEGRTVLHVAGGLPAFLAPESTLPTPMPDAIEVSGLAAEADGTQDADGGGEAPRITKYVPKPRKIGTGYLAKAKPAKFAAKPFATKPGAPASNRERRPFSKPAAPGFDKPWEEEKTRRLAAARKPSEVREDADGANDVAASQSAGEAAESIQTPAPRAYKPRAYKPRTEGFGNRPAFGGKPAFRGKPAFGGKPRFDGEGRPPRRDFAPREAGGDARTPRKTFSKPGTFGRKREGFEGKPRTGGKPAFGGESRPPRDNRGRDFASRSDRGDRGERPAFGDRRAAGSYAPRPRSDRPRDERPRDDRPRGDRPGSREGGAFAPRKPFAPRPKFGAKDGAKFGGKTSFSKAGKFAGKPREGPREGADQFTGAESKRVYRKFDAPRERKDQSARRDQSARGDRPARPYSPDRPARPAGPGGHAGKPGGGFKKKSAGDFAPRRFSEKPGGSFAGKKPFARAGGGSKAKPAGTFAKFAGNRKPFGKKPPARKFKPREDEQA
jgi:hypothetical protein